MATYSNRRRRAVALLVSLGVLFVLSVLAISFVKLQSIEREASSTHALHTRAKLAAEAGVRRALAGINEYIAAGTINTLTSAWRYHGEDADRDGVADAGEDTNGNGVVEFEECLCEHATAPSFQYGTKLYSGELSYMPLPANVSLLTYTLKVIDTSSRLDLNWGTAADLGKILESLGKAIDPVDPPIKAGEGALIIAYRDTLPNKKFLTVNDLSKLSFLTAAEVDDLLKFLTVDAWKDTQVIRPTKFDTGSNDPDSYKDDIKEVHVETRAPVNLNGSPREVLQAVCDGIHASYVEDRSQKVYPNVPSNGGVTSTGITITTAEASRFGSEVLKRRGASGAFTSWDDFYKWLNLDAVRTYIFDGSSDLEYLKADIVYANLNPNTDSMRFNPNASWGTLGRKTSGGIPVFRGCDKWDLLKTDGVSTGHTTEGTLVPTGVFEITSLGKVWDNYGNVASEFKIKATLSAYEMFRLSSQYDFEGESGAASHRSDVILSGYATKTKIDTYPEYDPRSWSITGVPQTLVTAGGSSTSLGTKPAIYDGQIMLACVKQGSSGTMYYITYRPDGDGVTDDLKLDYGSAAGGFIGDLIIQRSVIKPETKALVPGTRNSGGSISIPRFEWNSNLVPDGVLFVTRRHVVFGGGSIPGRFAVEFWTKPIYRSKNDSIDDLILSPKSSSDPLYGPGYNSNGFRYKEPTLWVDFTMYQYKILSCWCNYDSTNTVQFIIQNSYTYEWHKAFHTGTLERGQWYHFGLIAEKYRNRLVVDAKENIGVSGAFFNMTYIYYTNWGHFYPIHKPAMAYATMDEIRIFGGSRTASSVISNYLDGRYETSGSWYSPSITFPGGKKVTFLNATWTEHIPTTITGDISMKFDVWDGATFKGSVVTSDPTAMNAILKTGTKLRIKADLSGSSLSGSLRETPVLTDVTITYQPESGPRILRWETFFKK